MIRTLCLDCIMFEQHELLPNVGWCVLRKQHRDANQTCMYWCSALDEEDAFRTYNTMIEILARDMVKGGKGWKKESEMMHTLEARKLIRKRLSKEADI